jgi:lipopolysaccharide transport system permease protein
MKEEFDLVIEPGRIEKNYWQDIWRYRELFYILSWRDIKVRYKQTVIGITWSIIRPLLTMLIFTFVFGKLAKLPTEGNAPYAILVFAGMLPWQFFANGLTESSDSLITNSNLISKVYFPRLIIPISSIMTSVLELLISFFILIGLFVYFNFIPSWHILFLPFFIFIAFLSSFGLGLFLSSMNVKFRDFRYIVPFIVQLGLYISPVGFSSTIVPEKWKIFYSLNPMVSVIEGFRWCILGGESKIYFNGMIFSLIMICLLVWVSVKFFRKTEKSFADFI